MDLTNNTISNSGKVSININPATNTYSLVCNYCETGVRFSSFDEFLDHARDVHGPCLGMSSMNIDPEASNRPLAMPNTSMNPKTVQDITSKQEIRTTNSEQSVMVVETTKSIGSEKEMPSSSSSQSKSHTSTESSIANCSSLIVHPSLSPLASLSRSTSTMVTMKILLPTLAPTLSPTLSSAPKPTKPHHTPYDLQTLKRPCLLELIQLLNKCLCIWHKPTRGNATSKDRFRAYQLLLLKLREHQPAATFRNVRSIVRQLIMKFFHHQKRGRSTDETKLLRVKEEQDSEQCENSLLQQDPTKSRTVLDQLMFLRHTDAKDSDELDIDKLCSFCEMGFYTTEALWTHMINAHLPNKKKDKQVSPDAKSSRSTLRYRDTYAASTSSAAARSAAAHPETLSTTSSRKRSQSRDWRSANDTDYYTDCTDTELERRSAVRRSRRQKKCSRRYEKFCGAPHAKRTRHKMPASETTSNGDSDSSNADSKPSTYYLSDYSDKFLEDFIDLYRQHECLWQEKSTNFKNRKVKIAAYDALLAKCRQECHTSALNVTKVKRLIRRICGYYDRLNRPNANPYRSHIWQRLAFIEKGRRRRRNASAGSSTDGGGGDGPLRCNKCSRRFKRDKYYLRHKLKAHPPTECPPCRENFGNADDLHHHLLLHHNKAEECPLCRDANIDWKSPMHLAEHFYDHTCPMCAKVFHDAINFQRHKSQCRTRDRFKCGRCSAVFSGSTDFRRHAEQHHHDEHPFKCEHCRQAFRYLAPLTKHRRLKHK